MESILGLGHGALAFILVITIVVFVHEFGHFYFARLFGVKVDQFSIGFGKPIFKWLDKHGTQWKMCYIPLGGYIKMHGDANPASAPDAKLLSKMSKAERLGSFHHKPLWQKSIIIAAGPLANYMLAILIIMGLLYTQGMVIVTPKVGDVIAHSPASIAGLKAGDIITEIDEQKIESFMDLKNKMIISLGDPMHLKVQRGDKSIRITLNPEAKETDDGTGQKVQTFVLGIIAKDIAIKKLTLLEAGKQSFQQTYEMSSMMLSGIGQMVSGGRSANEVGGPIKIAQYSAKSMESGTYSFLMFIAMISINLGMVNLLPIPLLDGGHLFFYAIESITRRPLNIKALGYAYKTGFFMLASLMVYAISNDIKGLVHLFFHP